MPMIRLTVIYIALGFLMLTACEDHFLRARRVLQQDPKQAIELLKEAAQGKKACDECPLYMAMAYERLHNTASAEQALKTAAASKNPNIANKAVTELYKLYKNDFIRASDTQKKVSLAMEAQKIEKRLKIADGFAGHFLLDFYKKAFQTNLKENKPEKAVQLLKKALATFTAPSQKKMLVKDSDRALKTYFIRTFTKKLPKIQVNLLKTGHFDRKTSEIFLSNRFIVPSKKQDPMFDPARKDFPLRVRVKACKPLYDQLMSVVKVFYANSPLKLKPLDKRAADHLFQLAFPVSSAGYDVLNPQDKKKAGLPYLCLIRIKPGAFVNYLYFLWDI